MNENKPKYKVSIIGDSISTYPGFNPHNYLVFYRDFRAYVNGIESVDDTWWKQVIDGIGGELCINNSYSGSLVAGKSFPSACSERRCSGLHGEFMPDIILIYIGTNDRGFDVEIGMDAPQDVKRFYGAYRAMLKQLKMNYPSAKIVCGTLLIGRLKDTEEVTYDRFVESDSPYNEAIKLAAKEEECLLADIADGAECYETLDYCHPTKNGHKLMSALWLKALKSIL